jgi:hypothetical protein
MSNSKTTDTKDIFWKCGACSHAFFYILNREFGHLKETEERASDPLAGGLECGQQCGMLWGSTLAVGAESFRRYDDCDQAIAAAITTTQAVMESFSNRAKTVNCRDIIGCDLSSKVGMVKMILKTFLRFGGPKNSVCFNLAEKWAPEAIQSAAEGFAHELPVLSQPLISCAAEVAKKMGASDEEMVMVAGFAGGMGLSGYACGALGAAIWMNALTWCKNHPGEVPPRGTKTVQLFREMTGQEMLCHKITGRHFRTLNEHTEFIKNGGCDKLINALAIEGV